VWNFDCFIQPDAEGTCKILLALFDTMSDVLAFHSPGGLQNFAHFSSPFCIHFLVEDFSFILLAPNPTLVSIVPYIILKNSAR